jgi:putative inorganic carbon (hco3(-)) transporter
LKNIIVPETYKIKLLYGVCFAFIALNCVFIANEVYWFMALPGVAIILLLFFFSLDKLLMAMVFMTPFTFTYKHESMQFAVDIPNEPFVVGVMLLFFLKLIFEGNYDKKIVRHPLSIIVILSLVWMLLASYTSEISLVSYKYLLSRLWFVVTFYFVIIQLFKDPKRIRQFLWLFGASLVLVIIFITIQHSQHNFERKIGSWIVGPFFNDHTHYSSVIAFIAPVFIIMSFYKGYSLLTRRLMLIAFIVFMTGVLFSYSRATWLSIAIALGGFLIIVFKINLRLVFIALVIFVGGIFMVQDQILMNLERNRQESSGDFQKHAQSITNISSDASNLERINRWRAAYRMFLERPLMGFGPGTYQLVYAPYQLAEDHTIITTNLGDLGNAHSEYLGPLAEMGFPGMIIVVIMAVLIIITGERTTRRASTKELRWISLGITLGFITYLFHGFLNNFLDTDKASVLFWGFMAILVAIDIYHSPTKHQEVAALKQSEPEL